MYDAIIANALIIDGTGSSPVQGSIAIRNGVIQTISKDINGEAEHRIEAKGLWVTPGFIDVSNHSDTYGTIFTEPHLKSLLYQGVTTIIGGNCGTSLAPVMNEYSLWSLKKWAGTHHIQPSWSSMTEYYHTLEAKGLPINYASLVGYSTIRRGIIGLSYRPLTDEEIKKALYLVEESLKEGSLGVSLGLAFSTMQLVGSKEISELAELVKKYDRVLAVHLRDEGESVVDALTEIITMTRRIEVRTQINHLKILGKKNWKHFTKVKEILDTAIYEEQLPIRVDIFPYTANNSVAYILLPRWLTRQGRQVMLEQLQNQDVRTRVIAEMRSNNYDYARIIVSQAQGLRSMQGKSILTIAHNQGVSIEEAFINIIRASYGHARVIVESINQDHIAHWMSEGYSIVGSDEAGHSDEFIQSKQYDHPRSFGTFATYLSQYIIPEEHIWASGIQKLTALPADQYGLSKRGRLQEGYIADIVMFDPLKIGCQADFRTPGQYATGIEHMLIYGNPVIQNGEIINAKLGKVIKTI